MENLAKDSAAPPECDYDKEYDFAIKKSRVAHPKELKKLTKGLIKKWLTDGQWPSSLPDDLQKYLDDALLELPS